MLNRGDIEAQQECSKIAISHGENIEVALGDAALQLGPKTSFLPCEIVLDDSMRRRPNAKLLDLAPLLAAVLDWSRERAPRPPLLKSEELVVEEYKACRELTLTNIKIIERNETYILSAIGGVSLFGIAATNAFLFQAQSIIALLLSVIGAARYLALDHVVGVTDCYLREIEERMPVEGWSTFYKRVGRGPLGWSRKLLWIIVVAAAAYWVYFCFSHPPIGFRPK